MSLRLIPLALHERDPQFDSLAVAAETLAPFAVEVRYPGDWGALSQDEYAEAKQAAEDIKGLTMELMDRSDGRWPRSEA